MKEINQNHYPAFSNMVVYWHMGKHSLLKTNYENEVSQKMIIVRGLKKFLMSMQKHVP